MSSNVVPEITSLSLSTPVGSGNSSIRELQRNVPRSPGEEEDDGGGKQHAVMTTDKTKLTAASHTQLASTNNVGELVTKAKKAAASLWMILHAQNCRLPNCPHRGCTDTKPLLLHVKICSAGPNFPCPTHYKGCNEARKLMAHYRKCKDVRSRQQATGLIGRQLLRPADQGSCLVCSLMARYAKSMMEKTNNNNIATSQPKNDLLTSSLDGKVNTDENEFVHGSAHHPHPKRISSMTLMPPPPPRRLSHLLQTNGSKTNDQRNVEVTIPILWSSSPLGSTLPEDDGSLVIPCPKTNSSNLRQRAVSYDERQSVKVDGELPPATSGRKGRCYSGMPEDEELQRCDATSLTSSSRGYEYNFVNGTRRRSASCSNLNMVCNSTGILRSLPSHHECGTIAED